MKIIKNISEDDMMNILYKFDELKYKIHVITPCTTSKNEMIVYDQEKSTDATAIIYINNCSLTIHNSNILKHKEIKELLLEYLI